MADLARCGSSIAKLVVTDGKHSPRWRSIGALNGTVSLQEDTNNANSVIDQSTL
jgi:hypothetical protein